ncbi:hypothetical protein GCM10007160_00160 [Litchfieldella qijiaojingensis]|uniref:Uncharacterized protein n=1 Tax=Litchfieldella qijiaojingensis TaxID=980347 RepID=A0ABQ2YA10_9GAMM|nr:hypothetical protein GCM10007160_00160 [Halomonas qijiaojingensis]
MGHIKYFVKRPMEDKGINEEECKEPNVHKESGPPAYVKPECDYGEKNKSQPSLESYRMYRSPQKRPGSVRLSNFPELKY